MGRAACPRPRVHAHTRLRARAAGGGAYCGTAALALMGRLRTALSDQDRDALLRWCVHRAGVGFHGRPNKVSDTCYSYWVGATLHLLGHADAVDVGPTMRFHQQCRGARGGFRKTPEHPADIVHSYYSVAALSLAQDPRLRRLDPKTATCVREGGGGGGGGGGAEEVRAAEQPRDDAVH